MNFKINVKFNEARDEVFLILKNFNHNGEVLIEGNRNLIKTFDLNGLILNVKAFKKPNFYNKIIYRYFRKSKARRSFEYASKLIELNIGTPQPVAFLENYNLLGLKDTYYASEHLICDLTFRELVKENYPDAENILRQFTKFTFEMHQKGIEFLDHSPGNTLIKKEANNNYSFYLVDLNRMKFHKRIDFKTRMKNLSRLTPKEEMVAIMSDEYAKLSGENKEMVFNAMWKATQEFQHQFYRKKRLKKKLKFWKK